MITKIDLGDKWSGQNLGNQLFQIAALYGLARKYFTQLAIPDDWKYLQYFSLLPDIIVKKVQPSVWLTEPHFQYVIEYFDEHANDLKNEIVNINGVLQTEKYWQDYIPQVRQLLGFSNKLREKIYAEQKHLITNKTVAISVRRGDFITNPNHYLLPFEYYKGAVEEYFPDYSIVVFSDDFKWCMKKFSKLPNKVHYSNKYGAIEQLCFMSMFSNFIIANSTFSWWGAYLSSDTHKIVVRPFYVFDGALKQTNDIKDHYPEDWKVYRHLEIKRNKIIKLIFYNDNNYRLKVFSKNLLLKAYNLLPFKDSLKKLIKGTK